MFNLAPIKFQRFWPFLWPKMAVFGPKMQNIVQHIRGGLFGPLEPPKSVTRGPQKRQNWPFLAQKCNFLTIDASSRPKWVEHQLNKVEHCPTHSGGSVWDLRTPKKCHRGAPEASKLAVFGPEKQFLDHRHL